MRKADKQFTEIAFVLVLQALISCSTQSNPDSIDLSKTVAVSFDEVFTDVMVIQLETRPDIMITHTSRIEYYDSFYYILDEFSQQIVCFDDQGKFVFQIKAQGKGKGEYHYVTDLAIDPWNNQLVVLDPVVGKVHFYDLKGKYLDSHRVRSEKVLGLNRVYPMKDSVLLFTSITYESLHFYSLKDQQMIYSGFAYDVPSTLDAFGPYDNVYFFDEQAFFLAPLTREIYNVTDTNPRLSHVWCFGPDNNAEGDINHLLEELRGGEVFFTRANRGVGKDKPLNHHVMKSFENNRFRIAVLEHDDDFAFVLTDKKEGKTKVFRSFSEGFRLPFKYMKADRAIAHYQPPLSPREIQVYEREEVIGYYTNRSHSFFSKEILSKSYQQIIENHDPMNDNPFLVVYTFRK